MSPIRSLQFDPGGNFLLMAESADYIHVVDVVDPGSRQTMDFFGDITGCCWEGSGEYFHVGNANPHFGGMIEYKKYDILHNLGLE